MKSYFVHLAQSIEGQPAEFEIRGFEPLPLDDANPARMTTDARILLTALREHLPGGTLYRLTALLLRHAVPDWVRSLPAMEDQAAANNQEGQP